METELGTDPGRPRDAAEGFGGFGGGDGGGGGDPRSPGRSG